MLTLAIDTSGPSCSCALAEEGALLYEAVCTNAMTHSVNLMPMVEEAFHKAGKTMEDVGLIACITGPGSFTGVRIGVSCANGLALAGQIKVMRVDALEALAHPLSQVDALVCPIRDARVGQVYGAAFFRGERKLEDSVQKLTDYLRDIEPLHDRFLFVGDGVKVYRRQLEEALGEKALFAPVLLQDLRASACAFLAMAQCKAQPAGDEARPLYLRKPQAEREREARGKA